LYDGKGSKRFDEGRDLPVRHQATPFIGKPRRAGITRLLYTSAGEQHEDETLAGHLYEVACLIPCNRMVRAGTRLAGPTSAWPLWSKPVEPAAVYLQAGCGDASLATRKRAGGERRRARLGRASRRVMRLHNYPDDWSGLLQIPGWPYCRR